MKALTKTEFRRIVMPHILKLLQDTENELPIVPFADSLYQSLLPYLADTKSPSHFCPPHHSVCEGSKQ